MYVLLLVLEDGSAVFPTFLFGNKKRVGLCSQGSRRSVIGKNNAAWYAVERET